MCRAGKRERLAAPLGRYGPSGPFPARKPFPRPRAAGIAALTARTASKGLGRTADGSTRATRSADEAPRLGSLFQQRADDLGWVADDVGDLRDAVTGLVEVADHFGLGRRNRRGVRRRHGGGD